MSQRPTIKRSVWSAWLPVGVGACIFLGLSLIGNVMVIGSQLGTLHPVVERTFYACILLACLWLVVVPVIRVLKAPVIALDDVSAGTLKSDYKTLKRIAYQLADSDSLPADLKNQLLGAAGLGSDLQGPLTTAIDAQKLSATTIIREQAVLTFVSTAISQNGKLDAVSVLIANFRLVRRLVEHYGYRPPLPELIRIYGHIFLAALIADEIDDLDVEGILPGLAGGILGWIPGSQILVSSFLDGTVNALFTLRVGFVAQTCLLNAGKGLARSEVRRSANREARAELGKVLRDGAAELPGGVKGFIEKWI
jgi:hypothetical protein